MPEFKYRALDSNGVTVKDTVEAADKKEVFSILRGQGLFPIKASRLSASESRKLKIKQEQQESSVPEYKEHKKFKYVALKQGGEEVTGTIEAPDKMTAISNLRSRNLFPTKVQSLSGRDLEIGPKINENQLQTLLENEHKSKNIFTILKNYFRKIR